jgi:hypothetical protein
VISNAYWILASGIELLAGVLLVLSIFRFPIKAYFLKISSYCLALAIFHFNLFYVFELRHIVVLENIILLIILYSMIIKLPILLSALLALTGVVISALMEMIVVTTLSKSYEITLNNMILMGNILIITSTLLLVVTSIIQYFKIGFLFKDQYFSNKSVIKPYNYVISVVLIICLILTIYFSVAAFHAYLISSLFALGGGSIILIGYTYYQNKKAIEHEYNLFRK